MYAITYNLSTGSVLHRAKSASDALETMELLRSGGGQLVKIVRTQTGKEVSVPELQLLARRELAAADQPKQKTVPRLSWLRGSGQP